MKIKKISKLTEVSAHTLRYYEKIGLLMDIARDSKGHRYYSDRDVIWIEFIKRLKATNMPLNEIRRFAKLRVRGDSTIDERVEILENHESRVKQQMERLKYHQEKIREKIELCKRGGPLHGIEKMS